MKKLAVILVNYKTPDLLRDCLHSIYRFDTDELELIVVDNDSQDGTDRTLKAEFPEVNCINMGYNAGFARANNRALRITNCPFVLLLNTDTIVQNDALNRCLKKLEYDVAIACGVQLRNEDGSAQISGNYAMKGGLNYLLPVPYLGQMLKELSKWWGVKKPNIDEAKGRMEVDWINGAFLMVKKSAIDKAGLLDEDFFLYAEEAEWCSRLKKQGPLCIYGDLSVIHLQGVSAGGAFESEGKGYMNLSDRKGLQIMLSNFVRIRKEFGLGWFFFQLAGYGMMALLIFVCLFCEWIFRFGNTRYTLSQAIGYSGNIIRLGSYLLTIICNRPFFYKVL